MTATTVQALLEDGKLAGSWTLDATRSEVRLETRHTWGLRPLHGVPGAYPGHDPVALRGPRDGAHDGGAVGERLGVLPRAERVP